MELEAELELLVVDSVEQEASPNRLMAATNEIVNLFFIALLL